MFPLRDEKSSHIFPLVTIAIIGVTSYAWFLQLTSADMEAFIMQYALVPASVNLSDITTLIPFITSMFLHGGWLHFLSNMWFLWIFGDNVEGALGHLGYLFFYLITGLTAGVVQYFFMQAAEIPVLGASGAIAGVLGGYFVMFPHHRIRTLIPLGFFITTADLPASIMLGYWFILQLFSGFGSLGIEAAGGVAWWAHIAGFASGWFLIRGLAQNRHS